MLRLEGVTVGYGESPVLTGVDLMVASGQVVCLMGRNGAGKTTLLKTVMGVLRPWTGRIWLEGVEVTAWPPPARARAGIGYVPQGRGIFPYLTVHENLLLGLEAASHREPAAVAAMYELFPALAAHRERLAGRLSGGQQQQLALARALVRRPRLLLLDEPTEGIQPSIVAEIRDLLLALRARRAVTVLLVEQFLDFARAVADAYYILHQGQVVAHGPIAALTEAVVHAHLAV